MSGESKLTADYERFFKEYIQGRRLASSEHKAFLWGYYSHLITDVAFLRFVRDGERVKNIFIRIKRDEEMRGKIKNLPENFDTVKRVFGRENVLRDIVMQEVNYLKENPASRYNTVIKEIRDFPDYIAYFPPNAVARKIGIMAKEDLSMEITGKYIFFTEDDFNRFTADTSGLIYRLMRERLG